MKDKISKLGRFFKRINQLILVLPVWITLGLAGILQNFSGSNAWEESQKNKQYEKMY